MRLKLIACEILYRELCAAVSRSVHLVDVEFMPKGLHDIGAEGMSAQIQKTLAAVDESQYDAVVFGYALCSNGLIGLEARTIPLVIPRAHDCITLFLGDGRRYLDYFRANPGAYFKTSGWIERGDQLNQLQAGSIQETNSMGQSYEEMVEKYGEDNAKFLMQQLGDLTRNYGQVTFIRMGVEPDDRFERHAQDEAERRGWKYESLEGDMTLIQDLVDGRWDDERFLVVQPGERTAVSYGDDVIRAERP